MTVGFESGEIVIRDGAGDVTFTTAQGLFTITDFVDSRNVGVIALPQVTATGSNNGSTLVNREVDHSIATVTNGANIVFGMMRQVITSGGSAGTGLYTADGGDGLWRQVNGTHLESFHACAEQSPTKTSTDLEIFAGVGLLTFFISGTTLYMNEKLKLREYCPYSSGTFTIKRPAQNIEFRLYCGLFV